MISHSSWSPPSPRSSLGCGRRILLLRPRSAQSGSYKHASMCSRRTKRPRRRRGIKFYVDYAAERMAHELSGLATTAIDSLRKLSGQINPIVHPAHLSTGKRKPPSFDDLSVTALTEFSTLQKAVLSAASIALAALFRARFDHLPAMYRAQFDWLIGNTLASKLRSGNFGLP